MNASRIAPPTRIQRHIDGLKRDYDRFSHHNAVQNMYGDVSAMLDRLEAERDREFYDESTFHDSDELADRLNSACSCDRCENCDDPVDDGQRFTDSRGRLFCSQTCMNWGSR